MKILFIGDIVSRPGRAAISETLPQLKTELQPDIVIANAENLAHGRGVTKNTLDEMLEAGIDYFTGGDHIFWQRETEHLIEEYPVVRPLNYPEGTPGHGFALIELEKESLLLINAMGRTSFGGTFSYLDDPFRGIDSVLDNHKGLDNLVTLVDFHAEATSEKSALGFYLDGRVDAVVGTHTHIPTCDNRVLPLGTAFVTDVGMTGNIDSVLGVETKIVQDMFLSARNQRFEWENAGKNAFRSVIIDTAKNSIERVDRYL